MKFVNFSALVFASAVTFAAQAMSAEIPTWEFTGSTAGIFDHAFGTGGNNASNVISVGTGANYFVLPQLELGTRSSFYWSSSPGFTVTETLLTVGPTYNLSTDIANSAFVRALGGIEIDHLIADSTFTTFSYFVSVGQRIQIVNHVTWSPEVAFTGHTAGTDNGSTEFSTSSLEIIPFQFSILF